MSPQNHAKMDSITSMKHISGIPGTNYNATTNPSNINSNNVSSGKNLNIASLLSLQESDPIKTAIEKFEEKKSSKAQRFESTEDSQTLNEKLNPGSMSEYQDGAFIKRISYNAAPN